jgi:putative ATP-binding cassette transporter
MSTSITANTFRLAAPHWRRSPRRFGSWALGALLVSLVGLMTSLNYWMNQLTRQYMDALQAHDAVAFNTSIWQFLGAVMVLITVMALNRYAEQALEIRWRNDLTETTMARWLQGHTFYRMERDHTCDNPDQRLSQDITEYVRLMILLVLGFIGNLGTLGSMGWVLWQSAGAVSFDVVGSTLTIPGFMFWLAVTWGVVRTVGTHLAGHRLAGITVEQQSVEADFRVAMTRVRDAAEQVALYQGGSIEQQRLMQLFAAVKRNWALLMRHNVYLGLTSGWFSTVTVAVPVIAVAPKVLSGELTIGVLMQNVQAFAATSFAIAWFALSYRNLFQLSARVQRLTALKDAIDTPEPHGIDVQLKAGSGSVAAHDLQLHLPNGQMLAQIPDLSFEPGQRWLMRGPSGCGKSTLLRAMAGLWPFGAGQISLPGQARVMFVPQQSYLPDGPLNEVLAYPGQPDPQARSRMEQALLDCRLPHLVNRLGEWGSWGHTLSPGEQQRLAFAQVLLAQPEVLFLDEATSALDLDTEAHLMRLLIERLPQCTLVSVAHRATLDEFHDYRLDLGKGALAT